MGGGKDDDAFFCSCRNKNVLEGGGHVLRETTSRVIVCVYYCSTYYKAVRMCVGGNNGGHVIRETKKLQRRPCSYSWVVSGSS